MVEKKGPLGRLHLYLFLNYYLLLEKNVLFYCFFFPFLGEHRSLCLPALPKYPNSTSSASTQETYDWTAWELTLGLDLVNQLIKKLFIFIVCICVF